MNKRNLIIGIVVLVILIGGVVLWSQKNAGQNIQEQKRLEGKHGCSVEETCKETVATLQREFYGIIKEAIQKTENSQQEECVISSSHGASVFGMYDGRHIKYEKFDSVIVNKIKNVKKCGMAIRLDNIIDIGTDANYKLEKFTEILNDEYKARGIIIRKVAGMLSVSDEVYFSVHPNNNIMYNHPIAGYRIVISKRGSGNLEENYTEVSKEDLRNIISIVLKEDNFYKSK